ncbi:hypothetical protein [Sulfuracidifex tepidarius]
MLKRSRRFFHLVLLVVDDTHDHKLYASHAGLRNGT